MNALTGVASQLAFHVDNFMVGRLLVAVPVMVGMAVAAPELMLVLYGSAWVGAVIPLQSSVWSVCFASSQCPQVL